MFYIERVCAHIFETVMKLTFLQFRSSHPSEVALWKKGSKTSLLETEKVELQASRFPIKKETPTLVFSYEFSKVFKNTTFVEHLRTAVSANCVSS